MMATDLEQPAPIHNDSRPIWELVVEDMQARDQVGRERYGTPLQANNGRDALVDAYAEALDQCVYIRTMIEERKKRVIFCGLGRSGKDTACEYFAAITGLRNAGTVSKYLAYYVAPRLGLPVEEAYQRRGESPETRRVWRRIGDEIRTNDPALLAREMMAHGEIGGGVRGFEEMVAAKAEGIADLWVWIERAGTTDDTCSFGPEMCDVCIVNNGTMDDFQAKLKRLARFAGLLKAA